MARQYTSHATARLLQSFSQLRQTRQGAHLGRRKANANLSN